MVRTAMFPWPDARGGFVTSNPREGSFVARKRLVYRFPLNAVVIFICSPARRLCCGPVGARR